MEYHLLIVRFIVHMLAITLICSLYRTLLYVFIKTCKRKFLEELISRFQVFFLSGAGLAFCLSEQAHTNVLNFHYRDESDIDTSCLQDEIATPLAHL